MDSYGQAWPDAMGMYKSTFCAEDWYQMQDLAHLERCVQLIRHTHDALLCNPYSPWETSALCENAPASPLDCWRSDRLTGRRTDPAAGVEHDTGQRY
jgi:hypothetical protein